MSEAENKGVARMATPPVKPAARRQPEIMWPQIKADGRVSSECFNRLRELISTFNQRPTLLDEAARGQTETLHLLIFSGASSV